MIKNIARLIILTITVSLPQAYADLYDHTTYIRADAMGSKFNRAKVNGQSYRSKTNPSFDVGIGYNVADNMRAELVLQHVLPVLYTHHETNYTSRVKAFASAVMVRGYMDVIDLDLAKVFLGVGLGCSRVKHKVLTLNGVVGAEKSRPRYNTALNAMLGLSSDLSDRVNVEFGYMFANYGRTKGLKMTTGGLGNITMRSHNVFLGLRYEL